MGFSSKHYSMHEPESELCIAPPRLDNTDHSFSACLGKLMGDFVELHDFYMQCTDDIHDFMNACFNLVYARRQQICTTRLNLDSWYMSDPK